MNCTECGAAMTEKAENYRYRECGLPSVTLIGVLIRRCNQCGDYEVAIPRVEELHRLIARALIEKQTRLTGAEVRFLRKSLGLSGPDFARRMGVTIETVSRWENDAAAIGAQADRLLRLLVAQGKLTMHYPEEKLDRIDPGKSRETRVGLQLRGKSWALTAA
jgi:putative zinc finger/helix-turn-helix YgiT family protein